MGSYILRIDPFLVLEKLGLRDVHLDDIRMNSFVGRVIELSIRHRSFPEAPPNWQLEAISIDQLNERHPETMEEE